jgi:hypothetical protein
VTEFNENPDFARFLHMAKNDAALKTALAAKDLAVIDNFNGLSQSEKETLKVLDWKTVHIDIPNDIVTNIKPNIAARVCQETVGPTFATKQCTWRIAGLGNDGIAAGGGLGGDL